MASNTIEDAINTTAKDGLSQVSIDGRTAQVLPIADMIAAQRYLDSRAAAARVHQGLSFAKIEAPEAG